MTGVINRISTRESQDRHARLPKGFGRAVLLNAPCGLDTPRRVDWTGNWCGQADKTKVLNVWMQKDQT